MELHESSIDIAGMPGRSLAQVTHASTDGDDAVATTCALMALYAVGDSYSDPVQRAAADIAAGLGPDATAYDKAVAVHKYVRDRVRFENDQSHIERLFNMGPQRELLLAPARLLTMAQPCGDCDDFTMAVISILAALGVPCHIATVAADERAPEEFSHVYAVAHCGGAFLPVDASHGSAAGWEAPAYRRAAWPVFYLQPFEGSYMDNYDLQVLHGVSGYPKTSDALVRDAFRQQIGGGMGSWASVFQDSIAAFSKAGAAVIQGRYATPEGTFVTRTGADGSETIQRTGSNLPGLQLFPATGGGMNTNTLLLLGLGVVAIAMLSRRN